MNDIPHVWHYGLMAERWAEFNNEAPEVPYFLNKIEQFGQPVLDLGCGTGRVLLPLLENGVDIDGCDIPRQYRLIYICGSFGLSGSRENDLETLKRCHSHLAEGGALVINSQSDYNDPDWWSMWLPDNRKSLPQPWPEKGAGRIASDGSKHFGQFRLVALDPLEQSYVREVRLEKWVDGQLDQAEEYSLHGNIYFKHELLLMLKAAGFHDISVCGDYKEETATADHQEVVFTAIRR